MTDKEKKVIFITIGVLVLILLIVICAKAFIGNGDNKKGNQTNNNVQNEEKYTVKLNDGTKLNTSEELKKDKNYKTLTITNIQVTSLTGSTDILADVKNTGTADFKEELVMLSLIGEDGNVITEVPANIPATKAGQTEQMHAILTADIANIKDFTIKAK